jgi:hypothetical protein
VAAYRSFSKNKRKMNLQSILNKNSPEVNTKLEFGVLGVVGKLVKYVVHLPKRKKIKNIFLFSQSA